MKKRNDRQKVIQIPCRRQLSTRSRTVIIKDRASSSGCISHFTFLYGIVRINDISMKPSIKDGDLVVYYRLDHRFISGDVAVFEKDNKTTTGRVVAVAGDTVDITKDGLMINGAEQISQDIYFDTTRFKNGVDFPLTVKEGQIFVLGDNRPKASDSRIYGCIDLKDIRGKVIAIIRSRGI